VSVSSGHDVGVIEMWCWCASLLSGCDGGVVGVRCRCRRDVALVSPGRNVGVSVGVIGRWCWCRRSGSVSNCAQYAPPLPLDTPLLNIPQVAPNACVGYCPLHQQQVTQCPALPFTPAASTTPLMLLCCHLMRVVGMTMAAVPMQRTSRRVAGADAANSRCR